ncbi:MAG: hypothetical protein EOP13_05285 [Pseudomonas sp.]|jgi:hypothetical protein|uniref:hypothetical protein n=1 Tax=Pseudomonas sp. TaxID=306 RepID=UPI0012041E9D|nr:hypothetical protein [Pseudomonas sp.]RZI75468.1 MAG: hypothetical protein EOP13_05285 [Pseudomonas sp.]
MASRCALIASMTVLAGCAATPSLRNRTTAGHCDPPLSYRYNATFAPKVDPDASLTPELLARYPRRNLLTANAIGLLPSLQALVLLPLPNDGEVDVATELKALKQRQVVLTQVMLASSTVSSLAAELDCEGERADQMASHLADLDNTRTQRLNVLSIAIGAFSGIGTTLSDNRQTQHLLGVGGGLLGAGLGLFTLNQDGHKEDFQHARNLLTDVWFEHANSTIWPASVWHMLTSPAFSNEGRTSIAHNARARWQRDSQFENLDSEEGRRLTALLFGTGGSYSAAELKLRADMLNELQSSVRLLNQEIQGLLLALIEE